MDSLASFRRKPESRGTGLRVARLDSGLRRNDGYFVQSKKEYVLARAVSEGGTPPELAGRWGVVGAENGG